MLCHLNNFRLRLLRLDLSVEDKMQFKYNVVYVSDKHDSLAITHKAQELQHVRYQFR
jgi:hypothetical protein